MGGDADRFIDGAVIAPTDQPEVLPRRARLDHGLFTADAVSTRRGFDAPLWDARVSRVQSYWGNVGTIRIPV